MKQVIFPERIQSGGKHIEQSQRNHHSPAEMHQLIITETRDCPAYPHEEEYKEEDLSKEDKCAQQRRQIMGQIQLIQKREIVATEIKCGYHRSADEHIDVFREQVKSQFH